MPYSDKTHWVFSVLWNLDGPEMPETVISVGMPNFSDSFFFSSICLVLHQDVNRYPSTWGELFVSKNHEEYSLHRNWNPDWPKMTKVLFVFGYLNIPTRPSRELLTWIPASKAELIVFRVFFRRNNLRLCLLDWNFDGSKMKQASIWHSYIIDSETHSSLKQSAWILPTMFPSKLSRRKRLYLWEWLGVFLINFVFAKFSVPLRLLIFFHINCS